MNSSFWLLCTDNRHARPEKPGTRNLIYYQINRGVRDVNPKVTNYLINWIINFDNHADVFSLWNTFFAFLFFYAGVEASEEKIIKQRKSMSSKSSSIVSSTTSATALAATDADAATAAPATATALLLLLPSFQSFSLPVFQSSSLPVLQSSNLQGAVLNFFQFFTQIYPPPPPPT